LRKVKNAKKRTDTFPERVVARKEKNVKKRTKKFWRRVIAVV
jgi:hypothetical protein